MDVRMTPQRKLKMLLESFLTCLLCKQFLVEATTTSECVHTFCKECITKKFKKDGLHCCPVCNVELGPTPLDKLRPDDQLQQIRNAFSPTSREEPVRENENSSLKAIETTNIPAQDFNPVDTAIITAQNVGLQSPNPQMLSAQSDKHLSTGSSSGHHQILGSEPEKNSSTPVSSSVQQARGEGLVWFSLVASKRQRGRRSFPQLPNRYIRMDGSATVLYIHKYLMAKLKLESVDEVEILCSGQLVSPSTQIRDLQSWWIRKQPSDKVVVEVGSSAKDFIMELNYRRSIQRPVTSLHRSQGVDSQTGGNITETSEQVGAVPEPATNGAKTE